MGKGLKIFLVVILLLLVGAVGYFAVGKLTGKAVAVDNAEEELSESWLNDNCTCLERERYACHMPGFELKGKVCWKGSTYTNPVKRCSLYNCNGETVEFNGEN